MKNLISKSSSRAEKKHTKIVRPTTILWDFLTNLFGFLFYFKLINSENYIVVFLLRLWLCRYEERAAEKAVITSAPLHLPIPKQ